MISKIAMKLNDLNASVKILFTVIIILLFLIYPNIFINSLSRSILLELINEKLINNIDIIIQPTLFLVVIFLFYSFFIHKNVNGIPPLKNQYKNRVLIIYLIGLVEFILLYYFSDILIFYFSKFNESNNSWLGPLIAMLIASPIAFFLWIFRNEDKKKDLQHAEENIRQTDFHKIEEWATNYFDNSSVLHKQDSNFTEVNKHALQIAAIYQLLPFLKGEHGERFFRPSVEIYRSLLLSWKLTEDEQKIIAEGNAAPSKGLKIDVPIYIQAIHTIFREELFFFNNLHKQDNCLRNNWIPLNNIDLKCINLEYKELAGINLYEANLEYSMCLAANFENSTLKHTNFNNSVPYSANFKSAVLEWTKFRSAILIKSNFMNTIIKNARFDGAILQKANFEGADLEGAIFFNVNLKNTDFTEANLEGAIFRLEQPLDLQVTRDQLLYNTSFDGADLEGARFCRANLKGAIFNNADYEGANFAHANLKGTILDGMDHSTPISYVLKSDD